MMLTRLTRLTRSIVPTLFALSTAAAQTSDTAHVDKTFFTRRDLLWTGVAIAASAAVSPFDVRIAHWAQSPRIQGGTSRHDLVDNLTVINEQPLTLGALGVYGIGRLAGSNAIASLGLHATEALVLTVATSELIRGPLGRARPRLSPDDAFAFSLDKGFTDFGRRSYPSLHSAVGFATASVVVGEVRERFPSAVPFVAPVMFTAALVPGLTRMYLNQHWASDVVAGAFVGTLFGTKVVSYAYSHRRSKLDRWLLGVSAMPDGRGGVLVTKTIVVGP
jgi:membrane-associated phospholipid phosphatase